MSLKTSIGPSPGDMVKCLVRREVAPDRGSMRPGVLSNRRGLSFRDEQQTRDKHSQRGCDLSDRG